MGLLSGVGNLVGDITGANAAADAVRQGAQQSAAATSAASAENIDFQKWLWGEQTKLQQPYMDAGQQGLANAQGMMETGFQFDQTDPSYQFRLDEGMKGVESSAAAKGMQLSGSNLKDLTNYSQDYASTEYGNAYNRWQNDLKNQFGLAQMGQNAASGVAGQGANLGAQAGSSIMQAGQAQANMYNTMAGANAAQATSGFNTMMDIGGMAAATYGGAGWGA